MQYVWTAAADAGHNDIAGASFQVAEGICWTRGWDSNQARVQPCFLPVVTGVPTAIAIAVLVYRSLSLCVPQGPTWLQPFVQEDIVVPAENVVPYKRRWTLLTAWLSISSVLAFALQVAITVLGWPSLENVLPTATWAIVTTLVLIDSPRTAPISVLGICAVQAIAQAIQLATEDAKSSSAQYGVKVAAMSVNVCLLLVILCMPLREPSLPMKDISRPFTEPTSSLRSPEDNIRVWQFMTVAWMTPLMRVGSKRQLEDEDVWQLGYEFQHRKLHENFRQLKGTVISRLLRANAIDLVILTALDLLEIVAYYAVPVLLQQLLASMEDPTAPKSAAITYAAISLAVRLAGCQSAVFSLWFGRRCYERSRGEMITMLYEKTLSRKIAFPPDKRHSEANNNANGHTSGVAGSAAPNGGKKQEDGKSNLLAIARKWIAEIFGRKKEQDTAKEPASMGKILNLMRNDVYEVAQRFWEFQTLITKPLSCIFSITLVIRFLGPSALLALILLFVCQGINVIIMRFVVRVQKKLRAATDAKLELISQFVEAIRHLRWYGWQHHWLKRIIDARQKELNLRVFNNVLGVMIAFFNTLGLDLTPALAFLAYTVIAGKPLRIDIAFPALTLFGMMTSALRDLPNLITVMLNAWVAVGRIEDFMAEQDKQETSTEALIGDTLAIENGSFCWPGTTTPVLSDINVTFPVGLTVIYGEVASGKTALLQALLSEMDMLEGQVIRPQEPIGYCAQAPWLQSMSIRENILFGLPYEETRYKDVLDACALTPDLAEMKAGDLSLIGENGIGLSGGQRARLALARAVYSKTSILLLDDPLSALDQQTAEAIVRKCFAGPMLKGRTVVLVTHRTDLVLHLATQVLALDNGTAAVLDHDVAQYDALHRVLSTKSKDDAEPEAQTKTDAAPPEKFMDDEHRAEGSVQARVYWEYVKAGKLRWWAVVIVILTVYRVVSYAQTWFLKAWSEAYGESSSAGLFLMHNDVEIVKPAGLFDSLPPPTVDNRPWLIGYALLSLAETLMYTLNSAVFVVLIYVAARTMFEEVITHVANATFRFYDVTPVGRLMNRMTSDIGVIDGGISQRLQGVVWLAIQWIGAVVVIASITPTFLVFSAALTAAFVLIFNRFLPTSQSLRRLEMVSLTPLMSNFGALLNGLTTVRAFHAQGQFQNRVFDVVDTFQKMDHFYWSLQGWLMYRFDALSALSTFILTILALVTNLSPGLTAFVLISANKFVVATHYLCKLYGQLQMEFVSVERVVELLNLEQEPEGEVHPPAWWPSFSGDVVFENVTIKYALHLEPALSDINLTVKGGSKTAIIGRTGSGKSTLALSLLATILPSQGRILIDNVDLAEIDKQLLRTRITFLAQDPVLFPGTMRQNLDPVNEHSDEACSLVLQRVCGRQGWTLDFQIEGGGRNLSQGQRQLVGLARAVLRRSAIIILDEATASIDRETAMQIQEIMQEEMKESTVITIAHRLEAVKNADYCVVLGHGRIVRQGPAKEMLESEEDMVTMAVEEEEEERAE